MGMTSSRAVTIKTRKVVKRSIHKKGLRKGQIALISLRSASFISLSSK
jgi:hypothetical protein